MRQFDDTKLRIKIYKSVNFRIQRSGVEYDMENIGWIWACETPPASLPENASSGILWSSESYVIVFTTARDLNGWWPEDGNSIVHWENENWRPYDPAEPCKRYTKVISRGVERGQGKRGPDTKPRKKANYVRDNRPFTEKVAAVRAAQRKGLTGRHAIMAEAGITSAIYYKIMKTLDKHLA